MRTVGRVRRSVTLVLAVLAHAGLAWGAPPVPKTTITLGGAAFDAYQDPGATFRIVCQAPCPIAQDLIFAKYAGFKLAEPILFSLAGLEPLAAYLPVDLHLNGDSVCGAYSPAISGVAGQYASNLGATNYYVCLWDFEKTNRALPFTPANAATVADQVLPVHEYAHTIFYNRHFYSYEDVVRGLSYAVSGLGDGSPPVTDACAAILADFAPLIHELCVDAGFAYSDLAPTLVQLDALYRSGQTPANGRTTLYQWRTALEQQLGRDTVDAFLATHFPPNGIAADIEVSPAGGTVDVLRHAVRLASPAQAVSAPRTLHLEQAYSLPTRPGGGFPVFPFSWVIGPAGASFAKAVTLAYRIERGYAPPDWDLRTLALERVTGGNPGTWQPVAGSRFDVRDGVLVGPVTGPGAIGAFAAATRPAGQPDAVLPIVASADGATGSHWRTTVALSNPHTWTVAGRLVFHPRDTAPKPSDPVLTYSLAPLKGALYPDLLTAMGVTGFGSADVFAEQGGLPEITARVFNDAGAAGTAGNTEPAIEPAAALAVGDRSVLLAPGDPIALRFALGFRSLQSGATVSLTLRDRHGAVLATAVKTLAPTWAAQFPAADLFPGAAIGADASVDVAVTAGSAIVYGTVTDNHTNDPAVQIAWAAPRADAFDGETVILPTVGSAPGVGTSSWRTALQLHNPLDRAVSGTLSYHPRDASPGPGDPSLPYTLAPHETASIPDLLAAFGVSGFGSVDVVATAGPAPLIAARVYNDGGSQGTTGLTEEPVTVFGALAAGDQAVLVAPADTVRQRFNIGLRALERGARVSLRVVTAAGLYQGNPATRTLRAGEAVQQSASDMLGGIALGNGARVLVTIEQGNAIVYGTPTDNVTNDPSLEIPRRAALVPPGSS